MDEDVWEFIWMKFHSTTAVSEKKILLEALTCSDDRNLLNRYAHLIYISCFFQTQSCISKSNNICGLNIVPNIKYFLLMYVLFKVFLLTHFLLKIRSMRMFLILYVLSIYSNSFVYINLKITLEKYNL